MLLGNRLWMWAFSVEWVHLDWISKYKLVLKTIQNMALPPSNSPLGQGGTRASGPKKLFVTGGHGDEWVGGGVGLELDKCQSC